MVWIYYYYEYGLDAIGAFPIVFIRLDFPLIIPWEEFGREYH